MAVQMRKITALFLAVVIMFSAMPFYSAAASEGVLYISTAQQLADFAAAVNGGTSFAGRTVMLTTNISLDIAPFNEGAGWVPIGSQVVRPFRGVFDGGGHIIYGLHINREASVGLFGALSGVVRNLGIADVNIRGYGPVGGVAGRLSEGMIENVFVTGFVSASGNQVGGIAGLANNGASIFNSFSMGEVQSSGAQAGGLIGSLAGGVVSGSFSTASVIAESGAAGGLVGNVGVFSNVENSVALNPTVRGAGAALSVGRVSGTTSVSTVSNNVAFAGMVGSGPGFSTTTNNPNDRNGAAVQVAYPGTTLNQFFGAGWQLMPGFLPTILWEYGGEMRPLHAPFVLPAHMNIWYGINCRDCLDDGCAECYLYYGVYCRLCMDYGCAECDPYHGIYCRYCMDYGCAECDPHHGIICRDCMDYGCAECAPYHGIICRDCMDYGCAECDPYHGIYCRDCMDYGCAECDPYHGIYCRDCMDYGCLECDPYHGIICRDCMDYGCAECDPYHGIYCRDCMDYGCAKCDPYHGIYCRDCMDYGCAECDPYHGIYCRDCMDCGCVECDPYHGIYCRYCMDYGCVECDPYHGIYCRDCMDYGCAECDPYHGIYCRDCMDYGCAECNPPPQYACDYCMDYGCAECDPPPVIPVPCIATFRISPRNGAAILNWEPTTAPALEISYFEITTNAGLTWRGVGLQTQYVISNLQNDTPHTLGVRAVAANAFGTTSFGAATFATVTPSGLIHVGSLDGTNRITSAGTTILARYLTGQFAYRQEQGLPLPFCVHSADINGDGKITTHDLILFARWLAGHNVQVIR
ncbi:MAG: hypothetical protein FWC08_00010 [Defluviitaleaceae bacterium]|nr:hypothetical protein [Defluviitaleaceae bacterium]